jgi:large subunit ribosomal protein L10
MARLAAALQEKKAAEGGAAAEPTAGAAAEPTADAAAEPTADAAAE